MSSSQKSKWSLGWNSQSCYISRIYGQNVSCFRLKDWWQITFIQCHTNLLKLNPAPQTHFWEIPVNNAVCYFSVQKFEVLLVFSNTTVRRSFSSGSRGWGRGGHAPPPPGPVKISHKKDGRIHFMFLGPPPYPAAGSTTVFNQFIVTIEPWN